MKMKLKDLSNMENQETTLGAPTNSLTNLYNKISNLDKEGEDIEFRTIIGGLATGDINRARKNYAPQAMYELFLHQVSLAKHKNKICCLSNYPIVFIKEEASGLWHTAPIKMP